MLYIKTARGWKLWIPSCIPCSNSNDLKGVFTATPIKQVQREMSERADRFCSELSNYHPVHNGGAFRGHHFVEHLEGAFGEKL